MVPRKERRCKQKQNKLREAARGSGSLTSWSTTGKQKTWSNCLESQVFTYKIHQCFSSIKSWIWWVSFSTCSRSRCVAAIFSVSICPFTSSSYRWLQPLIATGQAIFVSCYYHITLASSANVSPMLDLMATVSDLHSLQHFSSNPLNSSCIAHQVNHRLLLLCMVPVWWNEENDIVWCVFMLHSSWKWVAIIQLVML